LVEEGGKHFLPGRFRGPSEERGEQEPKGEEAPTSRLASRVAGGHLNGTTGAAACRSGPVDHALDELP
jgi:hypothetical protein